MRTLETPRLLIRPFTFPDDLPAFAALVQAAFNGPPGTDPYRDQLAFNALADPVKASLRQPPYGDRAVVLRSTGGLVGVTGFVACLAPFGQLPSLGRTENARFTPEVGLLWAIHPDHQHHGYATEAARALIDYAFTELRLARIVATTEHTNIPSQAVMRRLGMTVERNPFPTPEWFQTVGLLAAPT